MVRGVSPLPGTVAHLVSDSRRSLVSLGSGTYSVSEVCRILQPGMTPRRVHYWLNTGILFEDPVRRGARGYPTLLSYRQLLEIRTVQHLKDELGFPLPRVRIAFEWLLTQLFADDWTQLQFTRGVDKALVAQAGDEQITIPNGQRVLDGTLPELNRHIRETRQAWEDLSFSIPGRRFLVANARILGGATTVRETRIDTALLASFADGPSFTESEVDQIHALYPRVARDAVREALEFEGLQLAA